MIVRTGLFDQLVSIDDVVTGSISALFLSILAAFIFAPIMIYLLFKAQQVAEHKKAKLGGGMGGDNTAYLKVMNVAGKNGTPNMGGILVWIVVPLMIQLLLIKESATYTFMAGFLLFGFWGFLDVLFTNMIKNNPEMKELQERFEIRLIRFAASVGINLIVTYLLYRNDIVTQLNIGNILIALSPLSVILLAIIGQLAIYAGEITDGLDGLMIGIYGIIYTGLAALLLVQGSYSFIPVVAIIIGVCIVDLYFNIPPARFFNGGPGAMPLSFGVFFICLVTDNLLAYFVLSAVPWIIMLSSMVQIISMRFFKKRIFRMAPLHHHFQMLGWPEYKVVMRFWLATMVTSIAGILVGLL